jgi:hypothetical protein
LAFNNIEVGTYSVLISVFTIEPQTEPYILGLVLSKVYWLPPNTSKNLRI